MFGLSECLFLLIVFLLILIFIRKFLNLSTLPPVPKLENICWGPENCKNDDDRIHAFQINIPDEMIDDLKRRLKNTRPLTPPLEGIKHEYGINSNLINKVVNFWKNEYDWRKREKFLNQYPQFKTKIQGLNIHFLHVKPKETNGLNVFPLLILHGWPGSIREFYEIIPLLTTPQKGRNFVFEVIAPSLPGYGFSDPAVRPGMGPPQMAVIMKNLMLRLGFEKFYIQAGDWGSIVMADMAVLFPEHVIAIHNNFCVDLTTKTLLKRLIYSFWPSLIVEKKYEHLVYPTKTVFARFIGSTGYYHIQATKPDTVGAALGDSPMGLAAYILEKFIYKSSDLIEHFKMEDLIDNIMIYWVTNSMTTAMRLYAEYYNKDVRALNMKALPILVPTGCSRFTYDLFYYPNALLTEKYPKLIHTTDHDGGHFAAFENPDILATDVYDFIEKVLKMKENQ